MIVGVGIDVCDIERFAASLERTPGMRERLFTPSEATRPVASLAARFAVWLDRWREPAVGAVAEAWLAYAHPAGTPLSVNLPDGSRVEGRFDGLAPDGALALRLASGERRTIHAGDVFQL